LPCQVEVPLIHSPGGLSCRYPGPAATVAGMPWTYILECADGSFYVGSTRDLEERVEQHNTGLGAAYTRRRRPVRLAWAAEFERIDEAYEFEKQVQNWSRAKRIALIEGRFDDLPDLASKSPVPSGGRRRSEREVSHGCSGCSYGCQAAVSRSFDVRMR
jgi:putative endonuclease